MQSMGHKVTLFRYREVASVPDGVRQVDAREIIGDRKPFRWKGKEYFWKRKANVKVGSFAPFSDLFRLKMLAATDFLWADLDTFLLRPLHYRQGNSGGGYYVAPLEDVVDNGILRLPSSSEALRDLIEYCADEYPVPPFSKRREKLRLRLWHLLGNPRHVSQLSWGVTGPQAVAWFLNKTGEIRYANDPGRVWHGTAQDLYLPRREFEARLPTGCEVVHLLGAHLRPHLRQEAVPSGSYIEWLLKHGD